MYLSHNRGSGETSGFVPSHDVCSFAALGGDKKVCYCSVSLSIISMVNGVSSYPRPGSSARLISAVARHSFLK